MRVTLTQPRFIQFILLIFIALHVFSCDEEPTENNSISENVPGLTSFKFKAIDNPSLFQDIIFTKQPDNSFHAALVNEVSLEGIKAAFAYTGNAEMNGSVIVSSQTKRTFADEFKITFDGKQVVFTITRYNAIPTLYIYIQRINRQFLRKSTT